jgi:hypothetical protein
MNLSGFGIDVIELEAERISERIVSSANLAIPSSGSASFCTNMARSSFF